MQRGTETNDASGVVMLESGWSLGISWSAYVPGGLSPSPVMLMLVDTLYSPPLLAKRASGPKHYFHFTKDRITTTDKKRGQGKRAVLLKCHVLTCPCKGFSSHELG